MPPLKYRGSRHRKDEWKFLVFSPYHFLVFATQPEIVGKSETRYYISSLRDTAVQFAHRIRSYWGVENKVHYVRDVTQAEDACRIRVIPLPQIWAIARNLALNLYRDSGFSNMAQAQRRCGFSLNQLKSIFRMK